MRTRAFAALALEAVGIAQRALELAVEYAKAREQFGKPIGIYQAVSHPLADSYVDTELARSLAYWAAWCVAEDGRARRRSRPRAAKAYAAEVAVTVCERSIQVHGGIGFTWEHPLHRYYKRAQWIQGYGGYPGRAARGGRRGTSSAERAVLVTGASSGIGAACAERLAAHGLAAFSPACAGRVTRRQGRRSCILDVTDAGSIAAAAAAVGDRLDGLVDNAGIAVAAPLEYLPLERAPQPARGERRRPARRDAGVPAGVCGRRRDGS